MKQLTLLAIPFLTVSLCAMTPNSPNETSLCGLEEQMSNLNLDTAAASSNTGDTKTLLQTVCRGVRANNPQQAQDLVLQHPHILMDQDDDGNCALLRASKYTNTIRNLFDTPKWITSVRYELAMKIKLVQFFLQQTQKHYPNYDIPSMDNNEEQTCLHLLSKLLYKVLKKIHKKLQSNADNLSNNKTKHAIDTLFHVIQNLHNQIRTFIAQYPRSLRKADLYDVEPKRYLRKIKQFWREGLAPLLESHDIFVQEIMFRSSQNSPRDPQRRRPATPCPNIIKQRGSGGVTRKRNKKKRLRRKQSTRTQYAGSLPQIRNVYGV